jgi:two-component SAPR family response regulator
MNTLSEISQKIKDIKVLIEQYEDAHIATEEYKKYESLRGHYGSVEKQVAFEAMRRTNEYIQFCYALNLKRKLEQQYTDQLSNQ